jgi:hypothetical protein
LSAQEAWKVLFRRALSILDEAGRSGESMEGWTFGGGTVLMRRFRHRVSKDVDIFLPDAQHLGYVSPRLNDVADSLAARHLETAAAVKLYFPEGEIDFIASLPLTRAPFAVEKVEGRDTRVETTAEILAKKVWHRGRDFTARDLLDFALSAQRDPGAVEQLGPILRKRRGAILRRIAGSQASLRVTFEALDRIETGLGFDDCVRILRRHLESA